MPISERHGKTGHAGGVHPPDPRNGALRVGFVIAPGGRDPPTFRIFSQSEPLFAEIPAVRAGLAESAGLFSGSPCGTGDFSDPTLVAFITAKIREQVLVCPHCAMDVSQSLGSGRPFGT
jgi:hypothetical protein